MSDFPKEPHDAYQFPQSYGAGPPKFEGSEDAQKKVKGPAITLIVLSIINILWALATPWTNAMMMQLSKQIAVQTAPPEEREDIEQMFSGQPGEGSFWQTYAFMWAGVVLSVIVSAFLLYGSLQMKSLSSYGWALAAAILAIIPFGDFCCCIELPVGIWALVVLLDSNVKAAFG